ncbi:MAG: porphobilinogen synthase [Candidatus Marinimicrobia bacterium]|nr:porphobilinogen synthase [Candidatus Neomarinimicrobiota bacterium]
MSDHDAPAPFIRPRRNRRSQAIRDMVAETHFDLAQLIMPLFIIPGEGLRKEIPSMPGIYQRSIDESAREVAKCLELGLTSYLLFGVPTYKDAEGSAAWQDDGIIQLALQRFTKDFPEAHFIADLCFCEYTDHGHCGVIVNDGVDNDQTILNLGRQAISLAQAGVHTVAPSGMMDGMVAAIRGALDEADFSEVAILSYAVKYASALYGPFREAVDCTPSFGDRRGYQMDPRNRSEAILEAGLDMDEGADMVMVKPAGMYLDIISDLKCNFPLPVVAYQVSGEYSMIKAASENGWLDGQQLMVESLTALFRAGADAVITYFARELAEYRRQ